MPSENVSGSQSDPNSCFHMILLADIVRSLLHYMRSYMFVH